MNFEPFIDYESVTKEMAADLHNALAAHKQATQEFLDGPADDAEAAARALQRADEMTAMYEKAHDHLYTVPVMVHIAGPKETETNPDDSTQEGIFQRCKRCGSVLNFWHDNIGILTPEGPRRMEEDDVPWWDEGTTVAKASNEQGYGMYSIDPERDLEKQERECVNLNDLLGA